MRFTANGERHKVRLGTEPEWNEARAEEEKARTMALVRRGEWKPAAPVEAPREVPTFHVFASEWYARQVAEGGRRGAGLTPSGAADLKWRLSSHLLPFFAAMRLDEITVEDVDRYRLAKVKAGKLNATSINKMLQVLAAILEQAVEYELIPRNVAKGKRRRLPATEVKRAYLDRADHIAALLDGASDVDAEARELEGQRRALVATLVFTGMRHGEVLALRWPDVDLARGTITVRAEDPGAGKTPAAARAVNLLPILRDELAAYAAIAKHDARGLVFATTNGTPHTETNVRRRIMAPSIEKANERLSKAEATPIATGKPRITPQSLRNTYASVLYALGEVPRYVMSQLGHASEKLALRVYAQVWDRRDGEPDRLKALVEGRDPSEFRPSNGRELVEETAANA
jgi:integrase